MWLFGRRRKREELAETEAVIQAIKQDTINKIDRATKTTRHLNTALQNDGGVTYRIFLATGGGRRK